MSDETTTLPGTPAPAAQPDGKLFALAAYFLTGYWAMIAIYLLGDVEPARLEGLRDTLSNANTVLVFVMGFFFGGALSGRMKDNTIASVAMTKAP
jgi:hypothetical protein